MRSVFHRALLLALLAGGALAAPAAAQFVGSLKVGAFATTFSGEAAIDFQPRGGWGGGVGFGYAFGGGFALTPELLYVVKGASSEITVADYARLSGETPQPGSEDVGMDLWWDLRYVEVPVLLSYRLRTNSRFHPMVYVGPSVSSKLSSRYHYRLDDTPTEFSETDDSIQDTDYSLVVGGGTEIEASGERLTLDVRALLGLSNVRSRDPALHNRGVAFFLGIVF